MRMPRTTPDAVTLGAQERGRVEDLRTPLTALVTNLELLQRHLLRVPPDGRISAPERGEMEELNAEALASAYRMRAQLSTGEICRGR